MKFTIEGRFRFPLVSTRSTVLLLGDGVLAFWARF